MAQAGSRLEIDDRRADPPRTDVAFTATLRQPGGHDYIDEQVGVLAAMWCKRSRSYLQLGFTPAADSGR